MQAKIGDTVKIHFTCTLDDGTVFDTSRGKDPLEFTIGDEQLFFKGLEQAVIGMSVGESKTVEIPSSPVYGQHSPEKVYVIPRDQFPHDIQPVVGTKFEIKQKDGITTTITITEVSESDVTLDANHPLAGKDLTFDIELLEIKLARPLAEKYYQKGVELQDKGQIDEAISYYQKTIAENPNFTSAFYNLGVAYQKKGMIDKSILYYEIAIGLNQDFVEAHHNLGIAFKEKGQLDEATVCFERVLQLNPEHAGAHYNVGNILVAKGRFGEAMRFYEKAIEINPDYAEAHWNVALLNLLNGNFPEGWKGYEWRLKLEGISIKRTFPQPAWEGSDINDRTLLLYAEQGFGDTIQFVRYAPLVAQRGARVVIESQKELVSLLKKIEGVSQVIARGEPLPEFDIHCPLMSLPLIFGTTPESIPAKIPYITADPILVQQWRNKITLDNSLLKVGLAWSGDPEFKEDRSRSIPFDILSNLAQFDSVSFYSLQKTGAAEPAKYSLNTIELLDYMEEIHDFSDAAALIENLDLIISVDTAVAHLAGALGKPVWTLLPFVPDWRWMLYRDDSPWYPTMKLFRQPARGHWQPVFAAVRKELSLFRKQSQRL